MTAGLFHRRRCGYLHIAILRFAVQTRSRVAPCRELEGTPHLSIVGRPRPLLNHADLHQPLRCWYLDTCLTRNRGNGVTLVSATFAALDPIGKSLHHRSTHGDHSGDFLKRGGSRFPCGKPCPSHWKADLIYISPGLTFLLHL